MTVQSSMKAVRIHRFGPPSLIALDDVIRTESGSGELLVRITAAGVGHWDALVREGRVPQPLPLILGSELSGIVEAIGAGVSAFALATTCFARPTSTSAEHIRSTRCP